MKRRDPFPSDETLDESASAWLCEREEGFTPGRADAFNAWRQSHPRHEAAVRRVEQILTLLDDLPKVRVPLEARLAAEAESFPSKRPAKRLKFPKVAWSAGVAALFAVAGLLRWMQPAPTDVIDHYTTSADVQRRIALSDGSLVDLNSGSDVKVAISAGQRRVTLNRGEAHFEVAHDSRRPFLVTAGGVTVRAVGTAFNVKMEAGSIDVLVVEGKVEVSHEEAPAETAPDTRPQVAAGELTRVSRKDPVAVPSVEKMEDESIRSILAWQKRMIPFVNLPLRDLVTQFNRRNPTQLVLGDPGLGDRPVGGMIAMDQLDAFVRLLEQDGDIVVERRSATQIVLRQAR